MITGAHAIIYSTDAEADRAFLRDILKLTYIDTGDGWLIFALPPAEAAVHPSENNNIHELFLMCDDVQALMSEMQSHNVICGELHHEDWGMLTYVRLPGGGNLGIYEPCHSRPPVGGPK